MADAGKAGSQTGDFIHDLIGPEERLRITHAVHEINEDLRVGTHFPVQGNRLADALHPPLGIAESALLFGIAYSRKHHIGRKDYKEIADRILKLRDMRQKNNFDDSAREEYVTRINDILDFIRKQSSELTVFDEALTRCWVKRIVIYGDKYTIEFKSGISVDIQS